MKEIKKLVIYRAITPISALSGRAIAAVDLPIQREVHTNWPFIQSSSIKGSLRSNFELQNEEELAKEIFGSADSDSNKKEKAYAAAFSLTDARILFFPSRSLEKPFVHVVAPSVLKEFFFFRLLIIDSKNLKDRDSADLEVFRIYESIKSLEISDSEFIDLFEKVQSQKIFVEDFNLKRSDKEELEGLKDFFSRSKAFDLVSPIIVSDSVFSYLVENATEIRAQISIDYETRTTKDGSLRYQEYLPSQTYMYSLLNVEGSRKPQSQLSSAEFVFSKLKEFGFLYDEEKDFGVIQLGSDFSLGKGFIEVKFLP